ncbi:MAG: hypothetical protein WAW37_05150 [Syntrophobacteraceae bacterium]
MTPEVILRKKSEEIPDGIPTYRVIKVTRTEINVLLRVHGAKGFFQEFRKLCQKRGLNYSAPFTTWWDSRRQNHYCQNV